MFYENRVTLIKPGDKVLEIGPGGSPSKYANVFLELKFDNDAEWERQSGGLVPIGKKNSRTVFYDGNKFPFADKEFDYIICSHVLEHVPNIEKFVSEINRVGKAGFFEVPSIYYEYLFNIPEHVNFISLKNNSVIWMPKQNHITDYIQECAAFFFKSGTDLGGASSKFSKYFFLYMEWNGKVNLTLANTFANFKVDFENFVETPMKSLREKIVNIVNKTMKKILWLK